MVPDSGCGQAGGAGRQADSDPEAPEGTQARFWLGSQGGVDLPEPDGPR